ncbi:MAG TPA: pseudouridine synthase [Candidatus Koribacter sp.]|jgi:23S rRNA pseudouridine2605 synthase
MAGVTARQPSGERRVGLARALSKLGYCSRSQAAAFIRQGRVRVNGTARRDPEWPVRIETDRILLEGKSVEEASKLYYMVNKPRGLVTTAADEKGRETVYSLLPSDLSWVAPVGRLDKASEGLLLMTNDSEWAARITDPASHLEKTYHVQVASVPDEDLLRRILKGIRCDGQLLRVRRVRFIRSGEKNAWIEIVLDEGRNRQIRRIFAALDIEVLRLLRVAIGPLPLGELPKGACRALTAAEKRALDDALRVRGEDQ